jgi:predicted NAD-dependent protein-ADP-ribosyltransferase YbiA (DUF1768 family)
MVNSKLKPDIDYNESKKLNVEDEGFATYVYETDLLETRVVIGTGKIKYTYTGKDIFYYLIYLMHDDTIVSQIGVLELSKDDVTKFVIDDTVDVEKFVKDGNSLLLYTFVTKEFLQGKANASQNNTFKANATEANATEANATEANATEANATEANATEADESLKEEAEAADADAEADVTQLHFKSNPSSSSSVKPTIQGELFEEIVNVDIPDLLKEETKAEADKLKNKSANANWVQKFMKNDNYRLQSLPKDGDSFFSTILYAFKQIGKKTTIEKLRNIVAEAATLQLLENYSSMYTSLNNEIADNEHKISVIKKHIAETKERYKNTNDIATNKNLLEQINRFKEDAKVFQKHIANVQPKIERFKFMKDVHSLQQLRAKLLESSYLADEFAISKVEEKLNIKMIIMSKDKFDDGDEDSVMMCAGANGDVTKPEYYILVSFDGTHYDLVSYKDKKILKFSEIPYYIKILVVNKCIERNAGVFHLVSDFRDFQTKFGIDPVNNSYESATVVSELYDDTVHFMFYINSANSKPGKGSGEKVDNKRSLLFKDLELVMNWRRQLDDEFASPFMLDNKQWQTVEHYYQASKFKKGFPDFYATFSLDSGSEISSDVKKAKAAGGKSGRFEKMLMRPNHIKLDADFYGGRDIVERTKAVKAKFEQNEDLKKTLLSTKKAKLLHFVRGSEPEIDTVLMQVRQGF